jgi:FKBP-type peptidyl-prolyl cis-trans isomerase 2
MMTVAKNCVVSMRYIMTNCEGTVLENTMNSLPVSYLHGAQGILLLLQEQLEGLKAGDQKRVYLTAAPGLTSADFVFEVITDRVRVGLDEEVLLGYPVQANVQACEADCDCYSRRGAEHG